MIVEDTFNIEGKIIKRKITQTEYPSTWEWEYFDDTQYERRNNSLWVKIKNHKYKTSKLVYPDKKEFYITYNT